MAVGPFAETIAAGPRPHGRETGLAIGQNPSAIIVLESTIDASIHCPLGQSCQNVHIIEI